jgi:hypothetical protein
MEAIGLEEKVDLLDHNDVGLETARQWLIIIFCLGLLGLFAVSIKRLYKTHHHFTFDCIILTAEAFKVKHLYLSNLFA